MQKINIEFNAWKELIQKETFRNNADFSVIREKGVRMTLLTAFHLRLLHIYRRQLEWC
jgi:phage anti-repressor protein